MSFTETWLSGPQSTQFYTRKYASGSPKAALVFIHGLIEHIGRYEYPHSKLSERGIAIFAFDLRGFGKTAQDLKNKSKTSAYGKTCWEDQMADIKWAIDFVKEDVPDVPVFLMGHSMGGGQVLGFATELSHSSIPSLAGLIASSPCIELTTPTSKIVRFVGGKLANVLPYMLIPAGAKSQDLFRDPAVGEAYLKDPLIKQSGSFRGLDDMLSKGEALLKTWYKDWPKTLPVLFIHGSDDKVTSHKATQAFHDKIVADDKKIVIYEGGYHDLMTEPDGVKDQAINEIVKFIEVHLPTSTAEAPAAEALKSNL